MSHPETYRELNAQVNLWDENGKLQLEKDHEAARLYFLEHVNRKMQWFHDGLEEKLGYLFGENSDGDNHSGYVYYDKSVFDQYTYEFIKSMYKKSYAYKFRFETFMGAYSFMTKYALKTADGSRYLERFEDRVVACALTLGRGDKKLVSSLIEEMMTGRLQPATPTFLNSGRAHGGQLVSCRLIEVPDDLNGIMRAVNSAGQLAKNGAGVAFNFSNIRGKGDPIQGVKDISNGVIPWCKILEATFSACDQLGQRNGSGAVYLHAHHMDIIDFLDSKKVSADEKTRLPTLNLGVVVPDITFELAANDEYMCLFSPYDVSLKYGIDFADVDITANYRELETDPNVRKTHIRARDFFRRIAEVQAESGYPYLMFVDEVNRQNPLEGMIKHSNLCVEIVQISTGSVIDDNQNYEKVGRDVSCNLASLNMANAIQAPNFGKLIETAMRGLTAVSEMDDCSVVPSLKHGNDLTHSVGLGAMNLHGAVSGLLGVEYDSDEARDFANMFFYLLNYHSLRASNKIAKETGVVFYEFEKSEYATGTYFDKYTEKEWKPETKLVKKFFEKLEHHIPTQEDWTRLKHLVQKNGLVHGYRLALAPTGSISYLSNATPSVAPAVGMVESRKDGKLGTVFVPAYGLNDDNKDLYKDAYQIGPKGLIDMMAVIQQHIDQSISTTVFYPEGAQGKDFYKAQRYAWQKGLKTLYYTRVKNSQVDGTEIEGCVSCAV